MRSLDDILEEYNFLDDDDKKRMLIELGQSLEEMPSSLKNNQTRVMGCQAQVWCYPLSASSGRLHFLADSDSSFTKGMIAIVLSAVQDRSAEEVIQSDIEKRLRDANFTAQLTSLRTSGLANMIKKVKDTAERFL